jgi:DNA-directed RNA polymerase subunit E'/Rpb7
MDPVFERRALVRSVHIPAQHIQRNIQVSLMAQLRAKYEGVCIPEGFVQNRSITVVEHSLGRVNLIHGGLDYSVKFQADICMPHPGQKFRAPVVLRSKIGLHADLPPMNSYYRRLVHNVFVNDPEVMSVSQDSSDVRFKRIILKRRTA